MSVASSLPAEVTGPPDILPAGRKREVVHSQTTNNKSNELNHEKHSKFLQPLAFALRLFYRSSRALLVCALADA